MIPAPVHRGRRLDWFGRFDPASRNYAAAAGARTMPARGRLWMPGRQRLDQGAEGACCGFAAAGEAAAAPVPVPRVTNAYARGWYKNAQRRDRWPGEAYDGTSVLATMAEGKARGVFLRYAWSFAVEQLAAAIARPESDDGGPAVIGVEWTDGSYRTDRFGILRPSGPAVGGHALCLLGAVVPADLEATDDAAVQLRADLEELDLLDAVVQLLEVEGEDAAFPGLNSWGRGFGRNGLFVVGASVVRDWFEARGEFAHPQQRQLPRRNMPEAETEQQETGDQTLHIAAVDVRDGDRLLDPPDQLGQESVTVQGAPRLVSSWRGERVVLNTTAGVFQLGATDPVTVRRD